ncbi:MAG TPA: hypothetical protein VI011_26180 [Asanoa sp.]
MTNDHATTGVRGVLYNGLTVVVDNNIHTNLGAGTNDDTILMLASQEVHLWEERDAPVSIRVVQAAAGSLGVLLVVHGCFAYTPGRYASNPGKITGTARGSGRLLSVASQ